MRRLFVLIPIIILLFCMQIADASAVNIVLTAKNRLTEKLSTIFRRTEVVSINAEIDNQYLQQYQDWQLITINLPNLKAVEAREPVTVIMQKGNKKIELNLWFAVKAYSEGYIATQEIPNQTPIIPQFYSKSLVDVAKIHGDLWQQTSQTSTQWTKKTIEKGAVILTKFIENIPEVKHGATVELLSQVASVEVTAPGIALMTGELGQIIHIKNLTTKKTVIGVVIGKNKVKVCEDKS